MALNFDSAGSPTSIIKYVFDTLTTEGTITPLDSCPVELNGLSGWTICYMVRSATVPYQDSQTVLLQSTYLSLNVSSSSKFRIYFEKFNVQSVIGEASKQFFIFPIVPGTAYSGSVLKHRLMISNSLLERDST